MMAWPHCLHTSGALRVRKRVRLEAAMEISTVPTTVPSSSPARPLVDASCSASAPSAAPSPLSSLQRRSQSSARLSGTYFGTLLTSVASPLSSSTAPAHLACTSTALQLISAAAGLADAYCCSGVDARPPGMPSRLSVSRCMSSSMLVCTLAALRGIAWAPLPFEAFAADACSLCCTPAAASASCCCSGAGLLPLLAPAAGAAPEEVAVGRSSATSTMAFGGRCTCCVR